MHHDLCINGKGTEAAASAAKQEQPAEDPIIDLTDDHSDFAFMRGKLLVTPHFLLSISGKLLFHSECNLKCLSPWETLLYAYNYETKACYFQLIISVLKWKCFIGLASNFCISFR